MSTGFMMQRGNHLRFDVGAARLGPFGGAVSAQPAPYEERCNWRNNCSLRGNPAMGVRTTETRVLLKGSARLAVTPPVEPMLAKLADELPVGAYLYEPKWDGFRAIVFRGEDEVYIQSRDERPLDRYFPELHDT